MLQRFVKRREELERLEQLLSAMPEYPIYRETNGRYSMYIAGELQEFNSAEEALLGQLIARSDWLYKQDNGETAGEASNESKAMVEEIDTAEVHNERHQWLQSQQYDDEILLYPNGRNHRGCPLYEQSGVDGVESFNEIIAHLSPDLRIAFFQERYFASLHVLNELEN